MAVGERTDLAPFSILLYRLLSGSPGMEVMALRTDSQPAVISKVSGRALELTQKLSSRISPVFPRATKHRAPPRSCLFRPSNLILTATKDGERVFTRSIIRSGSPEAPLRMASRLSRVQEKI
jgi:hypothetical protein